MKRCHIVVSGRVQGVFYRDFARRNAEELNLAGWVRNMSDSRVEVVAEGNETNLNEFLKRLKKGPSAASIDNLEIIWEEPTGEKGFEISY